MKYVKMLGLAAVAAVALMAFVGASSASATVLCKTHVNAKGNCPVGWALAVGEKLHAVSETEEPTLTGELVNVHCPESTVEGEVTIEGDATHTTSGAVKALTFGPETKCNCKVVVSLENTGSLEIHALDDNGNGTVTSTGTTVTVNCSTIFGNIHCLYKTNATDIGTLTGSTTTGGTATMDITSQIPKEEPSNSLCGSESVWHAKYLVTTPDTLDVATATE